MSPKSSFWSCLVKMGPKSISLVIFWSKQVQNQFLVTIGQNGSQIHLLVIFVKMGPKSILFRSVLVKMDPKFIFTSFSVNMGPNPQFWSFLVKMGRNSTFQSFFVKMGPKSIF